MDLPTAHLEKWMRNYYFDTQFDIGSSGVEPYTFAQVRELLNISFEDLDKISFHDSETLGDRALRRTIIEQSGYGDPDWIMATHGSSESIYLTMTTLLEPGDDVIVLEPCYQQLSTIAAAKGCNLHLWILRFEEKFKPNFDELEKLITPKTKMIVVNFPHNPTGTSIIEEEQQKLIALAASVDAYLVWDAAFAKLAYDGSQLPDPIRFYDKSISLGTLSKAYGLPGLRMGWSLAAPDVLEHFIHYRDYTTLHLSPLIELLATKAIANSAKLVDPRLEVAQANLDYLEDWIEAHSKHAAWVRPAGGVTAFVKFLQLSDTEDLCCNLAEQHKVLLVPGSCFNSPQFARLGFGGNPDELRQGLDRLSKMLVAANI